MRGRWSTSTWSCSAARRSASSPVPSGELSSITSTATPLSASAAHHPLEVLALVVGGQADDRLHAPMIAVVAKTLPRNAEVAEQLELLADLLEIEGAGRLPRARLPPRGRARPRDRHARRPARARRHGQGAAGDRRDDPGQDRPDRRTRARSRRSRSGARRSRPRWSSSCTSPASGPKTVRKIWQELGVTTLAELKEAARAERLRTLPGLGAKTEESILKVDRAARRRRPARRARCSARRCPRCSRSSRCCASIPPPTASPRPAARGGARRPCATSTSSPPPATRRR